MTTGDVGVRPAPVAAVQDVPTVDAQNPWPGLAAFTEDQRAFFFGRDDEAEELLRRIKRKPLVVLFGKSGLGKTSLLQAGLFPRLRKDGYLPVSIRLDYQERAPEPVSQIKTEIVRAVHAADVAEPVLPADEETLWEYFHRSGATLRWPDGRPLSLVLVFDQFEELFTLGGASATRARFLTELSDLVENRPPASLAERLEQRPELIEGIAFDRQDYGILLSLREDYLPSLESLSERMPSVMENRQRLTQMTGREAIAVVTEPAPDLVPADVARQIVRFVARAGSQDGHPDAEDLANLEVAPPILSLVCRELNNERLAEGLAQITAPLLTQNADTIIQDFYERCVADQPSEVRAFIEEELLTESGFRENMALEQARRRLTQRGAPAAALDELVRRRLLQLEERLDVQRIELTHDVLTEAIRKSRDARRQKEAIQQAEQREAEVRAKLRRGRKTFALVAAIAVVMSALTVVSLLLWGTVTRRAKELEKAKASAWTFIQDTNQQMAALARDNVDLRPAHAALLDRTIAYVDQLLLEDPENSNVRAWHSLNMANVGDLAQKMGKKDEALQKSRAALPHARQAAQAARADFDTRRLASLTFGIVAGTLKLLAERDEARKALQEGLDVLSRARPGNDTERARHLRTTALMYQALGEIEAADGRDLAARNAYQQMVEKFSEASAVQDDSGMRRGLFDSHVILGNLLLDQGDLNAAGANFEKAAGIRLDLSRESLTVVNRLANAFNNLANRHQGHNHAEARKAYQRTVSVRRVLVLTPEQLQGITFEHNNLDAKQDLAIAYRVLGQFELDLGVQGDKAAALNAFRESLGLADELVKESPGTMRYYRTAAFAHQGLGNLHRLPPSRPDESEAEFASAVRVLEAAAELEPNNPDLQSGLGSVQLDRGRVQEAVAGYLACLSIRRELLRRSELVLKDPTIKDRKKQEGEVATARQNLASALGNLAFAELFNRRPALTLVYSLEAAELNPGAVWIRTNLAHGYLFSDRYAEAEKVYLEFRYKRDSGASRSFGEEVLNDFRRLRERNVVHPDVPRIERLLTEGTSR